MNNEAVLCMFARFVCLGDGTRIGKGAVAAAARERGGNLCLWNASLVDSCIVQIYLERSSREGRR